MIENSQLQTLLAIRENHSFSKAAEVMGVTQSAISQSVKSLETKVGIKLVTRSGKNMSLTTEGHKLCEIAGEFFKDLEYVLSDIRDEKNNIIGDLHIGTLNGIGKSWVAARMLEFAKINKDLNIKVTMDFPDALMKKFEKNEIHCLVLPNFMAPDYAISKNLQSENTILVFPKDNSDFPIDESITLKELSKFPVVLFEEDDPLFYRWCRLKYNSIPRKINTRLVVNSFGHILKAVSDGMGIAVIPEHVYKRSFFKDKVSELGESFKVHNNEFSFIYHEEAKDLLKVTKLYEYLHENP